MPKTKTTSPHRVAVVQHPPVLLHRDKTIKRGVGLMNEAAAGGARTGSVDGAAPAGAGRRRRDADSWSWFSACRHSIRLWESLPLARPYSVAPCPAAGRASASTR